MELLSYEGRSDIAWKLATQTTFPSWIDMLNNRTTLSEYWKGGTVHMLTTKPDQVMENEYAVFHVESGKYNFSSCMAD